jgi:hypothetical protein
MPTAPSALDSVPRLTAAPLTISYSVLPATTNQRPSTLRWPRISRRATGTGQAGRRHLRQRARLAQALDLLEVAVDRRLHRGLAVVQVVARPDAATMLRPAI